MTISVKKSLILKLNILMKAFGWILNSTVVLVNRSQVKHQTAGLEILQACDQENLSIPWEFRGN